MNIPDLPHPDDDRDLFDRLREHYDIQIGPRDQTRPLGRGGFATVHKGTLGSNPGRPCAVKVWNQSARPDDPAISREVEALGELLTGNAGRLPNVVTLLREPIWEYDHSTELILVTVWELADRTLQDLLKDARPDGLPRETVIHFLEDVARGLDDLADLGLTHRDVKPANVLIFGSRAKLGDFGLARLMGASTVQTTGVRGTLEFMPPEALVSDSPEVSPTFDAYSFGVMHAYLRRGQTIFGDGVASSSLLNLHMVQRLAQCKQNGTMNLDGLDDDEAAFVRALCAPSAADRPREKLSDLFARLKAGTFGKNSTRSRVRQNAGDASSRVRQNAGEDDIPLPDEPASDPNRPRSGERGYDGGEPGDEPGNALDVPVALAAWQAADDAVLDASDTFNEIEAELLHEQRQRDELLQTYVSSSRTVRDQDATIAKVTGRLEQQQRLVNQKLHARDAADAVVCTAFDAQIAALDREVHRLTDPDQGIGYRRETAPVQAVIKQIDDLKQRQQPHLAGRDRHASQQPRIKVRDFLENAPRKPRLITAGKFQYAVDANGNRYVRIEPGEFLMGAPNGEAEAGDDEKPQHRVRISQPYFFGEFPETQAEFETVMGFNPSHFSASGGGAAKVNGHDTSLFPVESVCVLDVMAYANAKSKLAGLTPRYRLTNVVKDGPHITSADWSIIADATGFRMPTEAQREYANRAGTKTPFWFGTTNNGKEANVDGNHPYGTTTKGLSLGRTSRVGSYAANPFGVFDSVGNVWEPCEDTYDASAYQQRGNGVTIDPFVTSGSEYACFRGGSWTSSPGSPARPIASGAPVTPATSATVAGWCCPSLA